MNHKTKRIITGAIALIMVFTLLITPLLTF